MTYPGHPAVDFTFDWVGNRSFSESVYNAADQLVSRSGHAYQYDGAGNMTGDIDRVYAYSPDGLLRSLTIVSFSNYMGWDAAGNRVYFRTMTDYAHPYTFVYDPTAGVPAVIEEIHNGASVYYVREPGGGLICRIDGATTQYYHFDDLGSTLFLTGSDGAITDKYRYDAWGSILSHEGTTEQPYQYVGRLGYYTHYQDEYMAGLLQLGVRFYDPETGRFLSVDPLRDSMNMYCYVENRPVGYVDPWGLMRLPDYFNFNVSYNPFWELALLSEIYPHAALGALAGVNFSLSGSLDDSNPNIYLGIGPQIGKGPGIFGSSAQLGWLTNCDPDEDELNRFLSGPALNLGGGFLLGGSALLSGWIPGSSGTGLQIGWATPQAGASWTYNFQIWPWPPSWWPFANAGNN